ncbi:MAG: adenylate/guanylate cyclase domain-containing protein [Actinomycetota bacterium]|nr:adenylate/guanylate cyclase domain-containing protein [Actinomycetota bacterium]
MNMRQAIIAALRGDPELKPRLTKSLRARIEESDGPMATVVQAAEALEPIIEDAVRKRPSRLGKFGLKSAHLLGGLAANDAKSNRKLADIAKGSTVGIVFVDVAGFTTYTERYGDEAAIAMLNELHRIVEKKAVACKGQVVKHLGDGFLLAFPSASQAVRGALGLREGARKLKTDEGYQVRLRIAVHAGEPLIEQDDLLGHDVNLTARLLDHCKPDEVLASKTAKELADRRLRKVEFGRERRVKIRGLAGRKTIYSVNPSS